MAHLNAGCDPSGVPCVPLASPGLLNTNHSIPFHFQKQCCKSDSTTSMTFGKNITFFDVVLGLGRFGFVYALSGSHIFSPLFPGIRLCALQECRNKVGATVFRRHFQCFRGTLCEVSVEHNRKPSKTNDHEVTVVVLMLCSGMLVLRRGVLFDCM